MHNDSTLVGNFYLIKHEVPPNFEKLVEAL